MLDLASSEVCRRSTSFLREVVCADRVPAENRAMKSFNCAIFFSRCGVAGFHARADLRFGQHHVVVGAGVRDDALVVDVGRVGANLLRKWRSWEITISTP